MKKTRILIVVLLVIAVGFVIFSVAKNPPSPQQKAPAAPSIPSIGDAKSSIHEFVFVGDVIKPPETLKIYTLESQPQSGAQFASSIAEQLGVPASAFENVWRNDETHEVVTFSKVTNKTQYKMEVAPSKQTFAGNQLDKAAQNATAFLAKLGFDKTITPQLTHVTFFESNEELTTATKTTANIASIPFQFSLDAFPVFFNSDAVPFATVWVTADGSVEKAEFSTVPPKAISSTTAKTLTIPQALERLKNGSGSVISVQLIGQTLRLDELATASLERVNIEYRYTASDTLYYPYFHFIGTAKTVNGETIGVEIITPAVE